MARKGKKSNSLNLVKEVLTLIGGLAGSILAIYGLVKTFRDDSAGFSWLILVGAFIWVIFLWRLFQTRRRAAYSLIIISVFAGVIGWVGWQSRADTIENKVIVLVAQFDGPEEKYGLRRQMMEDLQESAKGYEDTVIIEGGEVVTSSEYARELGEDVKADLVIWAWYRPTENPNITVHIENLSPEDFVTIQESESYQPQASLAQLETFEIQRQLGSETSTLVSFLNGVLLFEAGDYKAAVEHFEQILQANDISTFISLYDLSFNLGYSQHNLGNYERAIRNNDKAIELDPKSVAAYNNRGVDYYSLEQYERAIQDYDKAIELDPEKATAYYNRAGVYYSLEQYERAIQDTDKAIELDPQFAFAYAGRGRAYSSLGQYERAIQDFDKVDEIAPQYSGNYNNRGLAYSSLGQYESAIRNYDRAIELDPENAAAYYNRGLDYYFLGKYELAIQDADKVIELNPQVAVAYNIRGLAYKQLGMTSEAEADFKKYEALTGQKP
jgi:tetratricopeptide (TPR) repeat protein